MAEEKEYRFSPKQVGALIIVLGVVTNGGNIADLFHKEDVDYDFIQLQLETIMDNDVECKERQDDHEKRYHDHVLNGHPESVQREIEALRNEIHYYFGGKRRTE